MLDYFFFSTLGFDTFFKRNVVQLGHKRIRRRGTVA